MPRGLDCISDGKLLVLDLLVALEGNAADHRVFDHGHHQTAAGLVDFDVLEQAGLDQRLQAVIDLPLIETPAGARLEIRADGLDFDAPVALDLDRRHGLGDGRRRNKRDASVAATGMANIIRAANTPPRTRIPTFMRNAPLSFQCRIAPLRTDRFPFVAPLVANFAKPANVLLQCNFIFIPRRCPSATSSNKPHHDAARCRMSL